MFRCKVRVLYPLVYAAEKEKFSKVDMLAFNKKNKYRL